MGKVTLSYRISESNQHCEAGHEQRWGTLQVRSRSGSHQLFGNGGGRGKYWEDTLSVGGREWSKLKGSLGFWLGNQSRQQNYFLTYRKYKVE